MPRKNPRADSQAAPEPDPEVIDVVVCQVPLDVEDQWAAERLTAAQSLVVTHSLVSAGAGLIPVPGVDVATQSGSQLWLLKRLSSLYETPFSDDLARKLIGALLAGFVPLQLAAPVAGVAKLVPLVGSVLGGLSIAGVGGAVTYAIGQCFIQHFESGGTLLTFDPARVRGYFESEYRRRLQAVLTKPKP